MDLTTLPALRLDLFDAAQGEGTGASPETPAPEAQGSPALPGEGRPGQRPAPRPDANPSPADRQGRFVGRTLERWSSQAAQAARCYPGLDLNAEARDPRFRHMLRAGIPVKTAYESVHHDQLLRAAARDAARAAEKSVVDGVRARGARPRENGTAAQSAFVVKDDVSRLTRKDMEDISRRVMRGEKISFG